MKKKNAKAESKKSKFVELLKTQSRPELRKVDPRRLEKYKRGAPNKKVVLKSLKKQNFILRSERKASSAQARAAAAELLLPLEAGYVEAEGDEKTYRFKQTNLKSNVDINTANSIYDFNLPELGPYCIDFSRNGRWLILGGRKGHLALIDTLRMTLRTEVQLKDDIRDVCALHNQNFMAVAQRKYVYIYDDHGAEVHCLRKHDQPNKLQFLKYHFLLVSVSKTAMLRYHDISTGTFIAQHNTGYGSCHVMNQNYHNGVIHCGHSNGVVTMWSPTMGKCLVSMMTHRGPVSSLVIDPSGNHMVTSGQDGQVKVWDLRMFKKLHSYRTKKAVTSMDISQRGLLALGFGSNATIWKDCISIRADQPYLKHNFNNQCQVRTLKFRPYEDLLGVGHDYGYSTLLVPGAGEPNIDTFSANPFETNKQRRESEVKALLDKLQPNTIALNPSFVGAVDDDPNALDKEMKEQMEEANKDSKPKKKKEKKKTRGKNKNTRKLINKQINVVDRKKMRMREKMAEDKANEKKKSKNSLLKREAEQAPTALLKFYNKR